MTESLEPKFLAPNPMSNINEALIRNYVADGNADALCVLFSSMRSWYQRAENERDIFMRRMHEMRTQVPRDINNPATPRTASPEAKPTTKPTTRPEPKAPKVRVSRAIEL